jgi:hypothetical protein
MRRLLAQFGGIEQPLIAHDARRRVAPRAVGDVDCSTSTAAPVHSQTTQARVMKRRGAARIWPL